MGLPSASVSTHALKSGQQPRASRSCQTVLFHSTRAKKGALVRVAVPGGPRSKAKLVEIRLPAIRKEGR